MPGSEGWREKARRALRERQLESDAVEAARAAPDALGREERLRRLESALRARGLTRAPLWKEREVEKWDRSHVRRALDGVSELARVGLDIDGLVHGALVRSREFARVPAPRRRLPVNTKGTWTEVTLDHAGGELLGDAFTAVPLRVRPSCRVPVSFDVLQDAGGTVAVRIGTTMVGAVATLPDSVLEEIRSDQRRGRSPWIQARLSRRRATDPPFLLEIPQLGEE